MPNLSQIITKREATLRVKLTDDRADDVTVAYRPDLYTTAIEATITEANERRMVARATADALGAVLVSWDFDRDGEPFPLTPENITAIGFPIAKKIWDAIAADVNGQTGDTKKG